MHTEQPLTRSSVPCERVFYLWPYQNYLEVHINNEEKYVLDNVHWRRRKRDCYGDLNRLFSKPKVAAKLCVRCCESRHRSFPWPSSSLILSLIQIAIPSRLKVDNGFPSLPRLIYPPGLGRQVDVFPSPNPPSQALLHAFTCSADDKFQTPGKIFDFKEVARKNPNVKV